MLPSSLFSIYRQYKQDTDDVVSWLARTAKARGYPADLLDSNATRPKSTRLKGKERKRARNEGKTNMPTTAPRYAVPIRDMIPLAEFIARCRGPFVSVPVSFSTTIDRLIILRSGFGEKLSDHGAEADPESTERHEYLVGVLEAVRDILRPRMTSRAPAVHAQSAASANTMPEVRNRFASLLVEEPSEAFINACLAASSEKIPKPQCGDDVVYEAKTPASREEVLFAYTMLLNDLNKLRAYIEGLWINVREGLLDLAACAVATDTAISLARGMIDEVAPLFKSVEGGTWHVSDTLFVSFCSYQGYSPDQVHGSGEDDFNYDLYDIADSTYMVAHHLLYELADVPEPWEVELLLKREGIFGQYNAASDRFPKSGRGKFKEDQILFVELFTELVTTMHFIRGYPVEDELLRGIKEIAKSREVSFSLVFTTQIYLDIHHVMRADTAKCLSTMLHEVSMMHNSLVKHIQSFKHDNWPAKNDHVLRQMSEVMEWMIEDPVYKAKAGILGSVGELMLPTVKPHRIMMHSPIICGLYLFSVRMKMNDVGVALANSWGSISYCAHLYNALQCQNLMDREWPDMETVLQLLGYDSFWVGGERPKTAVECFQKYCLQIGMSAATFADPRKRRNTIPLLSRAGGRKIKQGAPVSWMFEARLLTNCQTRINWTVEQIDAIVARSEHVIHGSMENGTIIMIRKHDPQELKQIRKAQQKVQNALRKGSSLSEENLSPGELVQSLALALDAEALTLGFPYIKMHQWCWKLLRFVNDACDSIIRERCGQAYIDKERNLPLIASHVLTASGGLRHETADKRIIQDAAAAFNRFLVSDSKSLVSSIAPKDGFGMKLKKELNKNLASDNDREFVC